MTWVRLSDTFADDPRLEEAGPEAFVVHVAGLCYCARQLTDGRIPARAAHRLWSVPDVGSAIEALIKVGVWNAIDGGYAIAGYLDEQPDAATVRHQQELKRARQSRWLSRARQGGDASRDASRDASKDAARDAYPAPPRPVKGGEGRAGAQAPWRSPGAARVEPMTFTMPPVPEIGFGATPNRVPPTAEPEEAGG